MKFHVVFPLAIATALSVSAQTPSAPAKSQSATPAKAGSGTKSGTTTSKPGAQATPASPTASSPNTTSSNQPADTATADDKIVMTVGNEKITAKEFDLLIDSLPEQYRAQARGPMKRQMAEQIARVKLLAAEARKRGLDSDKSVQARLQFQADNLLAGAAYNSMLQSAKVDDAALQKYFDTHKSEYETVQARHILVKFKGSPVPTREGKPELTEEQALAKAQEIRKQLLAGSEFAALAKAESDDAGSGANGGELGSFGHGQMVPPFEEAAFKLPVDQVSEPIKTQFGYHLIKVEKREAKSFDSVKGELEAKMKPEAARVSVEQLRKSSNVKLEESYFGPEAPAPQTGSAAGTGAAAITAPAPAAR